MMITQGNNFFLTVPTRGEDHTNFRQLKKFSPVHKGPPPLPTNDEPPPVPKRGAQQQQAIPPCPQRDISFPKPPPVPPPPCTEIYRTVGSINCDGSDSDRKEDILVNDSLESSKVKY